MFESHKKYWKTVGYILAALGLLSFINVASASHFRGGQISWTIPDPVNAPLTVEFTVTQNWRGDSADCVNLDIANLASGSGCSSVVDLGTGTDTGGRPYVIRQFKESFTFLTSGEYAVSYQSCCRIGDLGNGASDDFRVESIVSLGNGNGGGPNAALAAINTLQIGGIRTINVPAVDPDGDAVSCRFATDAETLISPSIPSINGVAPTLTNVGNNCQIEWDLTSVSVAGEVPYVLSLVFDSERAGIRSTTQADTTVILSSSTVPVPVCAGSGSFTTPVGSTFSHTLVGTKVGESLTVTTVGAPANSTLTPLSGSTGVSPLSAIFEWTPTANDSNTAKSFIVRYSDSDLASGDCLLSLTVPNSDVDGDGLPDTWENIGFFEGLSLSEARFGGVNEDETPSLADFTGVPYAPNTNRKDVYLWLDVLPPPKKPGTNADQYEALNDRAVLGVQRAFQLHGVNLHVKLNRITTQALSNSGLSRNVAYPSDFKDYKDAFGFNSIVSTDNEPVRGSVYRYGLFGSTFSVNGETVSNSGWALPRVDVATDAVLPANLGATNNAMFIAGARISSRVFSQAGTLMHELGHMLGLGHGGPMFRMDSFGKPILDTQSGQLITTDRAGDTSLNNKLNYISIMNYLFQLGGLPVDDPKYSLDFASFVIGDINENTLLFENTPSTNNDTVKRWSSDSQYGPTFPSEMQSVTYGTFVPCKVFGNSKARVSVKDISDYRSDKTYSAENSIGIDDDCNNIGDNDINADGSSSNILRSYSDWNALFYTLGGIGGGKGLSPGLPIPSIPDSVEVGIIEPTLEEIYSPSEYEVSVDILDFDRSTVGSTTLLQQFTVRNSGLESDTYDLTLFSYSQWTIAIIGDDELTLAPGEFAIVTVSIDVPAGISDLHQDTVRLRAEGIANATFDSKEVIITVDASAPADSDGDGLSNVDEAAAGTDPSLPDSDGDGLNDYLDSRPLVVDSLVVDPFSIVPELGVTAETVTTSHPFTFTGTTQEVTISISGGEYSIDGGAFTRVPGVLTAGQSIVARSISSPNAGDEVAANVNIGGQAALFKIITFDPSNNLPVANADSASIDEGTTVTINVLANDTDADSDTLSAALVSATSTQGGAVSIATDGSITYTPAEDFVGDDTFQYSVSDGKGGSGTGTVTVTVKSVGRGDGTGSNDKGGGSVNLAGLLMILLFNSYVLLFRRRKTSI